MDDHNHGPEIPLVQNVVKEMKLQSLVKNMASSSEFSNLNAIKIVSAAIAQIGPLTITKEKQKSLRRLVANKRTRNKRPNKVAKLNTVPSSLLVGPPNSNPTTPPRQTDSNIEKTATQSNDSTEIDATKTSPATSQDETNDQQPTDVAIGTTRLVFNFDLAKKFDIRSRVRDNLVNLFHSYCLRNVYWKS